MPNTTHYTLAVEPTLPEIVECSSEPNRRQSVAARPAKRSRSDQSAGELRVFFYHLGEVMKKRNRKTDGKGKNVTKLLVAMTGKASAAKAAEGDLQNAD